MNLFLAVLAKFGSIEGIMTIARVEKGAPTVAIGIYLRVLYALQLDDDILLLAQKDEMGRALQDLALKHRQRASKKWRMIAIRLGIAKREMEVFENIYKRQRI